MNPHYPSEDEIFEQALQRSGEARAAYLKEATSGDDQLRQRIENLLQANESAGPAFLNKPAVVSAKTLVITTGIIAVTEKPGDRIGRYKLREQIGEGGCGVVYVAEQEEPMRRRVALKVIKLGMDTKQVIARFEAERQALALMDHPNIAKVLDAGATDTGRPYFVMELVRGIKITDYCDQNNLSTETRLKLFIQVCSAIHHAHQKGIIHRDIKPSNILVTLHDGVPVPKVIDFGIAKATADLKLTDKTLYTANQQFLGTPAYMSPEQAEMSGLDIDTRSDIYSLGVLLYELLAGSPPFNPKELIKVGFDAMRKTICEVEPPRPSTRLSTLAHGDLTTVANHHRAEATKLLSSLRGDLDWIVMKALEKDRVRRYENVTGFAQDVQHYLSNEAVTARPPSGFYRFRKLVRRNKLLFSAIGAVAIAVLIGLVVSTWLFFREMKARGQAHQRQLLAETQLVRLTDRSAGWSQRAWSLSSEAAKIQVDSGSNDVRDQAAATLSGLDAQRIQQFTNFGASSVLFDQDGRQLLMGSLGDSTRLWDGTKNEPFAAKNSEPSPVAFANNTTPAQLLYDTSRHCFILSSLLGSKALHEWNIPQQIVTRMKAGSSPNPPAMTPDGTVIMTVLKLSDGNEVILAFRSNSATILHESTNTISSFAVSTDGRLAATAESGGQLEVWSLESGQQIAAFTKGRNEVLSLALKSVARTTAATLHNQAESSVWLLAAGDSGGNVTIYDVLSKDILAHCRGGHYQVYAVAFSPDGTTLASGGRGPVKLWDVATGALLLDIPTGDYITGLDFSPDGSRLAVSSEGIFAPRNVSVWSLDYGRGIQSLRGLSGQISKVCFSADGLRIAALSHKWEVGVWDVASGRLLRVIEAPPGQWADNAAIMLDSNGGRLAFSAWKKARLWNVESGNELNVWDLPEGIVDVLAFPDKNRLLLFRVETLDGKVAPLSNAHPKDHPRVCRIRDLSVSETIKPAIEIRDFNWHVFNAAASSDGRYFVVEGIQTDGAVGRVLIKAFDNFTGKELWSIPSSRKNGSGSFVADGAGRFIVLQTNNTPSAAQVEIASGIVVKELPWMPCAIHTETGFTMAPGHPLIHERGCSLFFDKMKTPAVTLGIDQPAVNSASFDPTGNLLIWGNTDGTLTVCNLKEINKHLASVSLQW